MPIVYDHRQSPPTRLTTRGSCGTAPGYVSAPLANLPPSLYLDGGSDPVPEGMVEVSRSRIVRDNLSVSVPVCEIRVEGDPNISEASAVLEKDGAREAVLRVIHRVSVIASLNVDITDWTIQGVLDAAEAAIAIADEALGTAIMRNGVCLSAEWARVVLHCNDSLSTADRLWPYLYDLALE